MCVVDASGKIVRDTKVASEPEALVACFGALRLALERIVAGQLLACCRRRPNSSQPGGMVPENIFLIIIQPISGAK